MMMSQVKALSKTGVVSCPLFLFIFLCQWKVCVMVKRADGISIVC